MEDSVKERLKTFLKKENIKGVDFCMSIGVSNGFISGMRKSIQPDKLKSIAIKYPNLNINWLMTGEGEMIRNKGKETNAIPISENKGEFFVENTNGAKFYDLGNNKYRMTVPLVPYCAYARFANEAETLEADREEWETESFIVDEVVHGKYFAFEIKSDSMDDGTRNSFEEGDRVLARELNRSHWVDGFRYKKRPYWVIVFDNSVLIKQIIDQDLEKGTITCHSLNDSPEYTDFTLELNKIRCIYYVVQKKPKTINF